jgi:hypothetical protein
MSKRRPTISEGLKEIPPGLPRALGALALITAVLGIVELLLGGWNFHYVSVSISAAVLGVILISLSRWLSRL